MTTTSSAGTYLNLSAWPENLDVCLACGFTDRGTTPAKKWEAGATAEKVTKSDKRPSCPNPIITTGYPHRKALS